MPTNVQNWYWLKGLVEGAGYIINWVLSQFLPDPYELALGMIGFVLGGITGTIASLLKP